MKALLCGLIGTLCLAAISDQMVGIMADGVTVPVDSITVAAASITVTESSIAHCPTSDVRHVDYVATVRTVSLSQAERLKALDSLYNQDDLFYLFFKPGEDQNMAVRIAAVNKLAEVDILKAIGERTNIQKVTETITNRLNAVYAVSKDRQLTADAFVVREYVRRLRQRQDQ